MVMSIPANRYYARQGRMSDPGIYAPMLETLPASIGDLVCLVQGLTLHVFWAERCGLKLPPERLGELQLRSIERRLARTVELDFRPLVEARPVDRKLIGNCRDYALLLTCLLRQQGIPARARCGFGAYFMPEHYEDHWVAEYWNDQQARWVLVDAQLDGLQRDVLKIDFDPLDVPRDRFIVGGQAWQMCRAGQADPDTFGIFDMHGLGFVRGNLVRDIASLNKMELLPWDCWGVILSEQIDNPADLALLDEVAALTGGDMLDFETICRCYQSEPRLRMDGRLLSFVSGSLIEVQIN